MVEAAGIEPEALKSVQRRKFYYVNGLADLSRAERFLMQRICSDFAATERIANVPLPYRFCSTSATLQAMAAGARI